MIQTTYKSRIPQIAADLDNQLDEVARYTAEAIAAQAKGRVPVDSGNLKRSIHVDRKGEAEYAVVAGDDDAFYGHMVEFGTSNTPPHPFLIPAAESQRQDYEADGQRAVDQAVATGGKRL